MKMTGYYLFSQALSVAMFESSIVITISGVEPEFKKYLTLLFAGGIIRIRDGMWLSLVERCVRDAEAASSNLVIPTHIAKTGDRNRSSFFRQLHGKDIIQRCRAAKM